MITGEDVILLLEDVIDRLGEETYYKHGPHECLDVDGIVVELLSMSAGDAGEVLAEVLDHEHGRDLVEAIVDEFRESDIEPYWLDECICISGVDD